MREWICEFIDSEHGLKWNPFCTNWSQPIWEYYHGKHSKCGAGPHPPMKSEDIETCVMFIRDSIDEWKKQTRNRGRYIWEYNPEEFRIRNVKTGEVIPASALGI